MAGVLTAVCGTAPCLLVCGWWKPSPGSDPGDHSVLAVPSLHPSLLSLPVLLGSSPHTLHWPHQPEQYPIASLTINFNINIEHSLERRNPISLLSHSFKQYFIYVSILLLYMTQLSPCPLSWFSDCKGDSPSPDLHWRVVSSGLLVVAPCVGTWSHGWVRHCHCCKQINWRKLTMCLDLEMSAGDLNLLHVSSQLGDGENDTTCLCLSVISMCFQFQTCAMTVRDSTGCCWCWC